MTTAKGGAIREDVSQQGAQEDDGDFDPVKAFADWDEDEDESNDVEGADDDADSHREDPDDQDEDEEDNEETSKEEDDSDEDPDEEGDEEDPKGAKPKAPRRANDDDEIVYKVGGEEKVVSVKDIRRLAGQEVALNQRGEAVASAQKAVDAQMGAYRDKLVKLVEAQEKRFEEDFGGIDLYLAAQQMKPEAFKMLRADMEAARANIDFLKAEEAAVTEEQRAAGIERFKSSVKNCVDALRNPEHKAHVPNWDDNVYHQLCKFGVEELGIPVGDMLSTTEPVLFKLLHLAYAGKQAQQKTETTKKKVVDNKKQAKPTASTTSRVRVVKPGQSGSGKTADRDAKLTKLRRTGDMKLATELFMDI